MESHFLLQPQPLQLFLSPSSMHLAPTLGHRSFLLWSLRFKLYCTSPQVELQRTADSVAAPRKKRNGSRNSSGTRANKLSDARLKENWLSSLSCPFPCKFDELGVTDASFGSCDGSKWVIGVDPDVSGAIALLRTDQLECSAQVTGSKIEVFDSPFVQMQVGKKARKRLDAKSIVQLIQSFNAPTGSTAYVEQSIHLPMDGKQGWWGGGFRYGLWIGVLVASGFSVVPVPSVTWKNEFELSGSRANKVYLCADQRLQPCSIASELFPSLGDMLKRKKEHGRAEALLIAAYGKRCKMKAVNSVTPQEIIP